MTERQTELNAAASDASSDPTTATAVDTAGIEAAENPTVPLSDPDLPAFDPGKFSRIVIPMALRQEMAQAKPPRLGPEFFQDTVPPDQPLAARAHPAKTETIPVVIKRRPVLGVVLLAVFGAVFVSALVLLRSFFANPETMSVPTRVGGAPATPIRAANSASLALVAPTLPVAEPNQKVISTLDAPVGAPAPPAQASALKSAVEHRSSTHPSPDPQPTSKVTPSAVTLLTAPAVTAPAVTAPASQSNAPGGFFGKALARPPSD